MLSRAVDRLSLIAAWLAQLEILVLVLSIVYEVVCRFGFNAPNIWSYDVSYMLSGTLFFLGAAYTLREHAHVTIDAVSARLPPRLLRWIHLVFYLVLFLPILSWITTSTALKAYASWRLAEVNYTSPWAPAMWPFYAAITVGLIVLWLQAAIMTLNRLKGSAQ